MNSMVEFYNLNVKEVLEKLDTNAKQGLSEKEAKKRLKKYGYNELKKIKGIHPLRIFFSQFKNFLILILIIAVIVSASIGHFIDAAVISIIIILNAILGFLQEFKAERAMEALKKMSPLHARVIENGKEKIINAKDLVPGDVIILEQGDQVPADARVIKSMSLKADEASLTGESVPVSKFIQKISGKAQVGERKNMVFMGTNITFGYGKAVVVETGMNTEFGKIAEMIQKVEEKATPLQKKLKHFSIRLGIAIIIISTLIAAVGIIQGYEEIKMFITGISLAVAAIPEGLPAIVTITLAIGLQKLAKKNAIVRRLAAAETLGSTTIICSDKTGTLTKNEMNVREIYVDKSTINVSGEALDTDGYFKLQNKLVDPLKKPSLEMLLRIGILCNNAKLENHKIIGDPTEGALLIAGKRGGMDKDESLERYPLLFELPFDSNRKRMTTLHKSDNKYFAYTKGAPESILNICDRIYEKGKIRKLTKTKKIEILSVNEEMGGKALRVLGFCFREVKKQKGYNIKHIEKNMIFVGLMGMIDPPRPEVSEAIKKCRNAGIKVKMITGDYKLTAIAIAKEIGLLDDREGKVITGEELDKLNDAGFKKAVEERVIFARVSPQHKLKIVKVLNAKGEVTAVTGDGVNDAPALKEADIGIAMGITGTDVTKEASEMILADDNFATIVSAIEGGRTIYDNIQEFIRYLLSCNAGEVLTMFIAALFLPFLPLTAIQILWMNLVTDGLPAVALGVDPPERDVMESGPRKKMRSIVSKNMVFMILLTGILMCIGTLFVFYNTLPSGELKAGTMAFTTLMMIQMVVVFNSKSEKTVLRGREFFNNKYLFLAVGSSISLQLAVIYLPFFNSIFGTVALSMFDWITIIILCALVFFILEAVKIKRTSIKNT